ncbi:MspA family porin [Gordonia rubripertincta]|uniref:MspA family porin n=1 Tax=Gordonia rubripertincta TaxID=36822 RepID=A0ABT4MZS4_GORRU|nr:MspA family porin [Gordonia rubripertincta]MCZ4552492.1 MspA family porin [Gordonia rubripertincta]
MSKMSMFGLRRVVGVGAITAVAALGLASMGAGNAAAGPLADKSKTTVGVDGNVVKITKTGESAYPVPSQANNGAGRAAEVSGLVTVQAGEAAGTITTGYLIGCQINIDGLEGSLGGSVDISGNIGVSGTLTVPLTPGEVAVATIGSKSFDGGFASIQYKRQGIDVQLCGGYAQARAFTVVQTEGNYVIKSTLYGDPFSIN